MFKKDVEEVGGGGGVSNVVRVAKENPKKTAAIALAVIVILFLVF